MLTVCQPLLQLNNHQVDQSLINKLSSDDWSACWHRSMLQHQERVFCSETKIHAH